MGCDPERVTGYVDGELSQAAARETRLHLWSCRACTAQAKFEIALGGILRSLPDPPTPPWSMHEVSVTRSALTVQ